MFHVLNKTNVLQMFCGMLYKFVKNNGKWKHFPAFFSKRFTQIHMRLKVKRKKFCFKILFKILCFKILSKILCFKILGKKRRGKKAFAVLHYRTKYDRYLIFKYTLSLSRLQLLKFFLIEKRFFSDKICPFILK